MKSFTLYGGKTVTPPIIKVSDVDIVAIAHALSRTNRYNGQLAGPPLSVAQHSVIVAKEFHHWSKALYGYVMAKGCLYALLHDAAESFVNDIAAGMKYHLPEYQQFERNIQATIEEAFGLQDVSDEVRKQVKKIDEEICHTEKSLTRLDYKDANIAFLEQYIWCNELVKK